MSGFCERLKGLIEDSNTTITAIARELGIARQSVSQYVDGTGQPNAERIYKISRFFGVSSDYLLGLSDTPTADTTIRAICEHTGLSDSFISWLETHKDYAPQVEKLSKLMIENGFIGGDNSEQE